MNEMIERVARVLAEASDFTADDDWPYFADRAKAAIEAMREPTAKMLKAGPCWEMMIDEALK